jgi:hypothetical protein
MSRCRWRSWSGLNLFEFEVAWITPGQNVPIGVVKDLQAGSMTAVMRMLGDGQFALVDAAGRGTRVDEWGAAIGGFAPENSPISRVSFHDWTSLVAGTSASAVLYDIATISDAAI